ncbi:hypothetical protein [Clostridium thermarum]|uniref:hypothetical protein n=1 Tax=Clostridium thermarum TaxID=1716543 RepID=UPI001123FDE7|nr:hypothetical protein [Clostridium thermarum]
MKTKKKKVNKTLVSVIITILVALILGGTFFASYYISIDKSLNSYEKNMSQAISKINSLNSSTSQMLKDNVIDSEAVTQLSDNILKELDTIKESVEAEVPGDQFKLMHVDLLEGIKLNKLTYMQAFSILRNPSSKDLKDSFMDFEKYRDDCESYYTKVSLSGVSPSLLKEAQDFLAAFKLYTEQLIDTQQKADMKTKQMYDFIDKLNESVDKFIPLKTDFSIELRKARDNSSTYDEVIAFATDYLSKNSQLQNAILSTTPPDNCKSLRDSFVKLTKDYDAYIQSFIAAVNLEKGEAELQPEEPLADDRLTEIYYDANNRFLGIQDKYDNFLKQFTDFKSTNIK